MCAPTKAELNEEKALKTIEELCKTLITTAGIMLALLWGLTQKGQLSQEVIFVIRGSSIFLVISITCSLLGLQFIVSRLQDTSTGDGSKNGWVDLCFWAGWITFLCGSIGVIVSIFGI